VSVAVYRCWKILFCPASVESFGGSQTLQNMRNHKEQVLEDLQKDQILLSADAITSVKGIRNCGYFVYYYTSPSCQNPPSHLESAKAFTETV